MSPRKIDATAAEVAAWMLDQFSREQYLEQDTAAFGIEERFGEDYLRVNDAGNYSINQEVLKEFRALTEIDVVWDRAYRCWRRRAPNDGAKRLAE